MKTFVIGDIHGRFLELQQCLQRSGFVQGKDRLICLGDVCDRGPEVRSCIDFLQKLPHCVYLFGNHDAWAVQWAVYGLIDKSWLEQGGETTIASYDHLPMPEAHIRFLAQAPLWFKDQERLFVHAGFDFRQGLEASSPEMLIWDRELLNQAILASRTEPDRQFGGYKEVFIGHTPVLPLGVTTPQKYCNVWALDTGAGKGGCLTIMDVHSKTYWQSDRVFSVAGK